MRRAAAILPLLALLTCHAQAPRRPDPPPAIILFVGDGMGVSQVTLGRLAAGGAGGRLALDGMPVAGLVKTHAANCLVTDSAAAATALASGTRTVNFAVGQDAQGRPTRTVLEELRDAGWATGLVTTTRVTHATPAAFVTHVSSRQDERQIARQIAENPPTVLLGGGARYFREVTLEGYELVRTREELLAAHGPRVLGLFHDDHMNYVVDRAPEEPDLPAMTRRAIELLSQDADGFFLMVEGGRIDHACHEFDAAGAAREMIEFDQAVAVALGRENTLVVVTADHATGGMAITEKVNDRLARLGDFRASASKITGLARAALPERRLAQLVREWTGVDDLAEAEVEEFYARMPQPYESAATLGAALSARIGVTFIPLAYRLLPPDDTKGHDGAMVPIYAWGPGAERFTGTLDLTDVAGRLRAWAAARR